jgi:hypothetical protein
LAIVNGKLAVQTIPGWKLSKAESAGQRSSMRAATITGRRDRTLLCVWMLLSVALPTFAQSPNGGIRFKDIAHQAGVNTTPHSSPDRRYLVEMMGGGVALFDCDNDGMLDILTVNDSSVDRYLKAES